MKEYEGSEDVNDFKRCPDEVLDLAGALGHNDGLYMGCSVILELDER